MVDTLGSGGISHYTRELCEHLCSAGQQVTLVTTFDYEQAGCPASFDKMRILFSFPRAGRRRDPLHKAGRLLKHIWNLFALTALAGLRRDCVIHYQRFTDRFFVPHLKAASLFGTRVVYTAHDVFSHEESPERVKYFGEVYDLADKVVTLTGFSKTLIEERFPAFGRKIAVVPHGNYDYLTDGYHDDRREAYQVILFFGNISRYKGLEVLMEAFNTVARANPAAMLLVSGKVSDGGMAAADYLDILDAEAAGRTLFIDAYVPIHDVPKYFACSHVVALPYLSATQSGVAQLAYSFGRPVVASRTGGLPEQVEEGRSGVLVRPGDPEELAGALLGMLEDTDRLREMGEYAKGLSDTRFGWGSIAAATLDIYGSLSGQAQVRCRRPEPAKTK